MLSFQVLTTIMVVGLLVSEYLENEPGKWITKPLASTGFIGAAWMAGAWESPYGRGVLLALGLCWLGDVLLIPVKKPGIFKAGIFSFLLGHIAFAVAFIIRGLNGTYCGVAVILLILPARIILRWLSPSLPAEMRLPVYAYILVISVMVALAAGTLGNNPTLLIPLGAVLFFCSDLSVARDRFITPDFINRFWGLPMYYAAQLIFAATVIS